MTRKIKQGRYYKYLRKSQADLEKERYGEFETLARHEKTLDELCQRDGYIVDGTFKELVTGESIAVRTEFQKLMELVSQRKVTGVIVHAVDRLGRGDMMEYGWVLSTFQYTHTLIITPGKVYDPTDPADFLALQMMMIISNGEYNRIRDRFKEGRDRSARDGQFTATWAPFGYDKVTVDGRRTLVPNDRAPVLVMIYEKIAAGMTPGKVVNWLEDSGVPTRKGTAWWPEVIKRIIANPVYKGYVRWGATRVKVESREGFALKKVIVPSDPTAEDYIEAKGLHEPLVSEELWQKANDMIGKATRTVEKRPLANPLAGLLRCAKCGYTVVLDPVDQKRADGGGVSYLRYKHRPHTRCGKWKSCKADVVTNAVVDSLLDIARDMEIRARLGEDEAANTAKELAILKKERKSLERKAESLIDLYTAEPPAISLEVFRKRYDAANEAIAELDARIAKMEAAGPVNYAEVSKSVTEVAEMLKNPKVSAKKKNDMLKKVVDRIEMVNNGTAPNSNDIRIDIFLR